MVNTAKQACGIVEMSAAVALPTASAGGLVTSINKGETSPLTGFEIDKLKTRCTRLRKNLGIAAKALSRGTGTPWMLTLTYRRVGQWKPSQIKDMLQNLRKWAKRAFKWTLQYLWVMESKKRLSGPDKGQDVPHYHLVVWLPVQVQKGQLFLDVRGWWPHGHTQALKVVAPVRYVMKYTSKFDSESDFPKGARCYGIGGLDAAYRSVRRWINWPAFVQARASVADSFSRQVGGGWIDRATGQWWPSEYGLSWSNKKRTAVVRLHDHGRPLADVHGPYNWISPAHAVVA